MSTASLTEDFQGQTSKKISRKLQALRKKRTPHQKVSPFIPWSLEDDADTPPVCWSEWQKHLAERQVPADTSEIFASRKNVCVLLWGIDESELDLECAELIHFLQRASRSKRLRNSAVLFADRSTDFIDWHVAAKERELDCGFALECLAMVYCLPRLAAALEPEPWWDLFSGLVQISTDATALSLDDQPLLHQLLAGELALAFHFSFPEVSVQRDLAKQARDQLSLGMVELLDGEGLPHADNLMLLRPLLACWSRAYSLGEATGKHVVRRDARVQYEWCVRQAIRLTRSDGSQSLQGGVSGGWCPDLFDLALDHSNDLDDDEVARLSLPGVQSRHRGGRFDQLPSASVHSEWAEVSILRSSWRRKSHRLTVAHANRSLYGELEANGEVLWSGDWNLQVQADGQPIRVAGDWEVVCWFTDEDGDYLELEAECERGFTLQRQMLLTRKDKFFYLADIVMGTQPAELEYALGMQLSENITYSPDSETTEGFLVNQRGQALAHALPLSLPEWRDAGGPGRLEVVQGALTMSLAVSAQRLYVPLWFDLDTGRMGKPVTWRQLTIAEKLQRVSPDQAVGFRVQKGKKQWLIYRSLTERANRTLLGQNLCSDSLIASFRRDGTTETLVEIE